MSAALSYALEMVARERDQLKEENERLKNELYALSQDDGKVERALERSEEQNRLLRGRVKQLEEEKSEWLKQTHSSGSSPTLE